MKTEFEAAARNVETSVSGEIDRTSADLHAAWSPDPTTTSSTSAVSQDGLEAFSELPPNSGQHAGSTPVPEYRRPGKNWRLKRGATPQWYKRKAGIRGKALSGAARVARFRPTRLSP